MLNIIKAELYKYLHRPFMYVFSGLIILGMLLISTVISLKEPSLDRGAFIEISLFIFSSSVFFMLAYTAMFYEEYKDGTIKNLVTSGTSRNNIFIGKLIAEFILVVITFVISTLIFLICAFTFFKNTQGYSPKMITNFCINVLAMSALCLGGLSFGNLLSLITKKEALLGFTYLVLLSIGGKIVKLLQIFVWDKFKYLEKVLLMTQMGVIKNLNVANRDIINAVLVGVISTIVFTIIGMVILNRQEVK